MASKLRWGILGVAGINKRLLPAFASSTTADLRAIASRTKSKADDAAAAAGIPKGYGSYAELLQDPEIDAVYIPLPNHLHDEWTRKAADAGKHILCEKPLTPTAKQAEALVKYCQSKSVRLMDGFMWPHHPRTKAIRTHLDTGVIGKVMKVNAAFTFALKGLSPENIRLQSEAGGGSLLDVGCYCVYAIRWWMRAEPVSVYAKAQFLFDVDVALSGILTFADGRTAAFDCGFTHPHRTWVEIVGTKGMIRVPNLWTPYKSAVYDLALPQEDAFPLVESIPTAGHDQIVLMLDNFAAAVAGNAEAIPDPMEAVKTLKVLDTLADSARNGREVAV